MGTLSDLELSFIDDQGIVSVCEGEDQVQVRFVWTWRFLGTFDYHFSLHGCLKPLEGIASRTYLQYPAADLWQKDASWNASSAGVMGLGLAVGTSAACIEREKER